MSLKLHGSIIRFADGSTLTSASTGGGGSSFDQNLNTTDNVIFNTLSSSQITVPALYIDNSGLLNGIQFADGSRQYTAFTGNNGSGGLGDSDSYIICKAEDDILLKYEAAKALTPGGNPRSSSNRATLVIMPGVYQLSDSFYINAEYVDIIGLGSIKKFAGCECSVKLLGNIIISYINNFRIKGIEAESFDTYSCGASSIFEDCYAIISGYNFHGPGTFINCEGSYGAFGSESWGLSNGTYISCKAGVDSFGGGGYAQGYYINCVGGNYSFGGYGTAIGSFINCSGGDESFGAGGVASGIFKNCSGGAHSFGGSGGTITGFLFNCILLTPEDTFVVPDGSGKIRLCIDGNYDIVNASSNGV